MKTLSISQIHISSDRQRKNFDLKDLQELGESIKSVGLLHPIILRWEVIDLYNGGRWVLVAGERRLRAITDLYEVESCPIRHDGEELILGQVPYVDLGELDPLAREEAEYEENIRRANLTWQEQAMATSRLASLRGKQALSHGLPIPPISVIAEEIRGSGEGSNQELTRREIIVAKHFNDPEVKGAKDANEAYKILKRKEDTQKRVELAAVIGKTYSADTAHQIKNEDSLLWMTQCEAGTFDVICTDPIYGIGADEFGDSGGKAQGAHFYEDSYETWKVHVGVLAKEGFRITKEQAHLYAFCDITHFEEFKSILSQAGWDCFRTPLIWHKPNGPRTPWVNGGPQRKYELVLYARKGGKPVTRIYPDLVSYPADENLGHQAQKPVGLFLDLLRRSVSPGDKVLDPFAGSGPIIPAANELKLKCTAIEIDPAAYGIMVGRMKKLNDTPELEGLV